MKKLILLSWFFFSTTQAQWSTDPTNNLIVGYGLTPELASDSAGGCYIAYIQQAGIYDRVWLERLNRYGYKPWETRRQIVGALPEQTFAKITEDGFGGVIVSYWDVLHVSPKEPSIERLRVQRVDSSGNFLWGPTGVRVSLSETNQGDQAIVLDGAGGCIVAWVDTLGALRINRISATGNRMWGDSGKYVWNSPAMPLMVADGQHGCLLVFGASRVQRIDQSGTPLWGPSGIQLENIGISKLVSDGSGGVVLAGMKFISYNNGDPLWGAKAQRVDSLGQILWGSNGLTLEDSLNGLFFNPPGVALSKSPDGGATIAWGRRENPGSLDLQAQVVRSDGNTIFPFGGRPISRVASGKGLVGVLPSDSMTAVFVWGDSRTPGGIYAQRLDTVGQAVWDSNDVPLNVPEFGEMLVTTDGNGGCIGVGFHQFDFSIRALQANRYGLLGQVITSANETFNQHLPDLPILYQNYPNPFNSQTTIRFQLPRAAPIVITLYNILGQTVKTLASGIQVSGLHSVIFEAGDLPSGMYFYRLSTPQSAPTHKLIIIK